MEEEEEDQRWNRMIQLYLEKTAVKRK